MTRLARYGKRSNSSGSLQPVLLQSVNLSCARGLRLVNGLTAVLLLPCGIPLPNS